MIRCNLICVNTPTQLCVFAASYVYKYELAILIINYDSRVTAHFKEFQIPDSPAVAIDWLTALDGPVIRDTLCKVAQLYGSHRVAYNLFSCCYV